MPFLNLLPCEKFLLFFRWLIPFWWLFLHFLKKALYNTWKSHSRELQVPTKIINKKARVKISSISDSKNPPWNLYRVLYQELLLMIVSVTMRTIVLILLWFRITKLKALGFHNDTHLFDQSSLDVSSRGVFRTLSSIQDGAFFRKQLTT